jgi:hypothetical protein
MMAAAFLTVAAAGEAPAPRNPDGQVPLTRDEIASWTSAPTSPKHRLRWSTQLRRQHPTQIMPLPAAINPEPMKITIQVEYQYRSPVTDFVPIYRPSHPMARPTCPAPPTCPPSPCPSPRPDTIDGKLRARDAAWQVLAQGGMSRGTHHPLSGSLRCCGVTEWLVRQNTSGIPARAGTRRGRMAPQQGELLGGL